MSLSSLILRKCGNSAQARLESVAHCGEGSLAGVLCPDPEQVILLGAGGLDLLDIKLNMDQYGQNVSEVKVSRAHNLLELDN